MKAALIAAALSVVPISVGATDMRYCALWAREYVRVGVQVSPDPNVRTADSGYLSFLLRRAYSKCLITEADAITLPDIPESTDEAWAQSMARLLIEDQGTEPATEDTTEVEWVGRCKKEYRTFRVSDSTVIRRGSRGKRTPCPHKPEEQ